MYFQMGQFISSMNKYRATFLWASFSRFVWWGCYLFRKLFDKMNVWIIIGSQQRTPISVVVLVIVIIKCYRPTCPFYEWRERSLKNRCDLSLSLCIGYLLLPPPVTIFFILLLLPGANLHTWHWQRTSAWAVSTSRESQQKMGRGRRMRSGHFFPWLLPRFLSLAVHLYGRLQALPRWPTLHDFLCQEPWNCFHLWTRLVHRQ